MGGLSSKVLSGAFLLLLIRIIQRGIGLISILILARLLTPEDFGVIAISLLIIHFCDALSNVGSQQYIVRKTTLCDEDVHTAWTLDLIMKVVLWGGLLVSIPFIADFYENPQLENVLYVSSLVLLIGALKSPGLILLRRDMNYKPIFKISIYQKFISFAVVMLVVYISPSYWALIAGDIVAALILTIGSYFIHSARPKWSLTLVKQQWPFSQWMLLRAVTGYVRGQVDVILVSKFFTAGQLGMYNLARQLSVMPSTDIIGPAIQPLLAAFSRTRDNEAEFAYQFTLSFLVVCILILPAAIFMWFFPQPVIDFFLGDQWTGAYPILSALAIFLFAIAISQVLDQCCVALGKVKTLFAFDLASLIFIATTLIILHETDVERFAIQRGILSVVTATVLVLYLSYVSKISSLRLLAMMVPVAIAAIGAAYVLSLFGIEWSSLAIVNLLVSLIIYGLSYIMMIFLCYWLYYRHTREGRHLFRLSKDGVLAVMRKIK